MTNARVVAPVEEIIHGVLVRDPYRWLEDRTLPETDAWIGEQQRRCTAYFAACAHMDVLRGRVREYLDIEVIDQPARVMGRYFYRRRRRGEEQASIYVRDIASGQERLLLDPSDAGPFVSAGIHHVSPCGSLLAYELRRGGEGRRAIQILDVESGDVLPAKINPGYARGFTFTGDCRGFYYSHETSSASEEHQIGFHGLDGSGRDAVAFRMTRSRESRLVLTADKVYLGAIWIHEHPAIADFWIARRDSLANWKLVFTNKKLPYSPFLKDGRIFIFTDENAPNGKLIELTTDGAELRTIVAEQNAAIRQLAIVRNRVFAQCLHDLAPSIRQWSLDGEELGELDIPADGTIQMIPSQTGVESLFYVYESFVRAPVIFEYKPECGVSQLWHQQDPPRAESARLVRRLSFASKDGTPVPLTLIERPARNPSWRRPAIMTGYGGFGVPMTPQFSVLASVMTELGAIFVLPNVRGGGDFGKAWHEAGRGLNRQKAYDDFIAAAEWLCQEGLTSPQQLAIFGGSNSGLLVAAAMTQRPDLFRAVLCIAPLLDMLRYEQFDLASKWRQEFGTVDDEQSFHALYAYSPYHRVQNGVSYPAAFFVSGDRDDRCNPMHARKMVARLQENQAQTHAIILDYSSERGHSPVLPLSVRIEALACRVAFLCRELKIPSTSGRMP